MENKNYIQLEIKNNLAKPAAVIILAGQWNPNNQANATELYEYDLSAETFIGVTQLQLFYYEVGSVILKSQTVPMTNGSIAQVAAALNSLNMGLWFTNSNMVYTYSFKYIFDNLTLS